MSNWGIRRVAAVLLAVYVGGVATVLLWPTPVDRPIDGQLKVSLASMHSDGIPAFVNYSFIEAAANVGMFVPLGILFTLLLARRLWWLAPILGMVLSTAGELSQHYFLPNRFGTVDDVIHNTMGAIVGCLMVLSARGVIALGNALANANRNALTGLRRKAPMAKNPVSSAPTPQPLAFSA